MTDNARATAWVACHCCSKSFPAGNVVRFHDHPGDAICITCAGWLYNRSRPIARRLNPSWQLPPVIRTWLQHVQ